MEFLITGGIFIYESKPLEAVLFNVFNIELPIGNSLIALSAN